MVPPFSQLVTRPMKKYFPYALLMISMCIFTACPSDDDDEHETSAYNVKEKFMGYWVVEGIKNASQKKGVSVDFVLFKEGKMRIGSFDTYETWKYDETTKILATTALINDVNLQWEITIIDDNQWAGIGLWDVTRSSTVAKQGDYNNLSYFLLTNTKWVNVNNSNKKVNIETCRSGKFTFSGNASPDGKVTWTDFSGKAEFDKISDILVIKHKNGKMIKLQHPFSLSECRLIFEDYNYIENGTYKRAD